MMSRLASYVDLITEITVDNKKTTKRNSSANYHFNREECECEQSIYWANLNGNRCFEYNIMYWYHPDYPSAPLRVNLGSVELVTDNNGAPYQPARLGHSGGNVDNVHSFSSRFRFNEGQAYKNKPVAYFSAGARLPRWQKPRCRTIVPEIRKFDSEPFFLGDLSSLELMFSAWRGEITVSEHSFPIKWFISSF